MKNSILEMNLTDGQFFALSNKIRRVILGAIYHEPKCPRHIAEQLNTNIVSVKRHLRILLECGLVIQSLQGNVRMYQSNDDVLSLRDAARPEEPCHAI